MKTSPTLRRGVLAVSLGLAALPALADDDCNAPMERWQSREAVKQMAVQQGWQIQRLKIDDGCYEIRATDKEGRAFKAKIDPETLKVLKTKSHDRERARERDRDHAAPQAGPAPAAGATTAPSPLFTPGTAPRGQVN